VNRKTSKVSGDPPGSSSQPALLLAQTKRSRFPKFLWGRERSNFFIPLRSHSTLRKCWNGTSTETKH